MRFITSEFLKNEINENVGEELIESKYELTVLIAKRAKQIAEKMALEPDPEAETLIKPITEAINEFEANELEIIKNED